ncbi:TipJ family phage tail tip protein [Mannheimia indoligenes]|uniref:TipJ family phage tail tip protein n=1 Tax=Mannheimia indoligenes TaxID=3103145 RepID=UPI002FE50073
MRIYGAKGGGGSSHTPIEAPETGRSKQIVNIVELICEGEIEGLVDGFKSIYLDGTKIQNDDGSYNFNNVSGQLNVGTQDQEVLEGYDSSQNEVNVGVEVKKKNGAIVRTVTDERINRLRLTLGVRSLFHQNNQGDTNTTSVSLKITIGTRQHTHTFDGKYSSQYLESVVFDNLPPVPFNISVERLTDDSNSQRLQNSTIWSSYTEIIDTEFTYPNSAVAGISFDSEYFNNIPTRNYLIKAKRVKVPSNYDPTTRTYSGFWDGTFKIAWTNNPAWEIYDLGPTLSKMLGVEISFDKWALYDVSRYCDQLVPDGMGGQEPRFTCNVWLTEVKTAYDLLNDFCSVFRAIPIWTGTEVSVIIDRPRDPVWTYTNANVVGGFERSYSARKSRHNAVQVTYSDKTNGYESAIEYVSDDEEIKKHGLNLSQVTAFGCTSRGQAHRTGKWILETEKREKETITFTVGREGLMHLPGDIIRVADSHYAGTEIGGRVLAVNGRKVALDREISIDNASYFTYINAEATHSTIKIRSVKGKEITLDSNPTGLEVYGVWSLSTQQLTSGLYRSISIVENADGTNTITALQHEPQKEAIVDNSAHFVETARTLYKAPQINAVEVSTGYDGKLYISSDISSGNGKLIYDIKITKDGNLYQYKKGLSDPNIELSDLPNGDYTVVIYGKNAKGQIVTEKTQTFTIDRPPAPTGVVVTGGLGNITLEWDWVNEVTQTEIFAAEEDNFALAEKIAKVTARTYAHTVKGNKVVRYYWLRHTRGINVGPFYQQQGVKGESAVDLDTKLDELNKTLSKNVVNEIIDTALPARQLGMTKYVQNLNVNTYQGQKQVYDTTTNKLYSWNGSKYLPLEQELSASAIKGIIQPNQIAQIPTGQLSGTITDSQLSSVSANKLTGTVSAANLAPIPTTKLTGTIGANQIAANSIGANAIQAGAIGATHLAADSVSATAIQANSVGVNALQANAVNADKIQANAITAAKIQAAAINAQHIAAGQISADKLAIGLGGNLLQNPIFANNAYGWRRNIYPNVVERAIDYPNNANRDSWVDTQVYLDNENLVKYSVNTTNTNISEGAKVSWFGQTGVTVNPNQTYIFSAYVSGHRLNCRLYVDGRTATGGYRGNWVSDVSSGLMHHQISNTKRLFVKFTVPSDVNKLDLYIMGYKAGSSDNAIMFVARPMLEECTEYTQEPSAWQNAGVTSIHGGSIVTNTVTAQQIAANTITANEIAAGTIAARNMAANSINASHIVGNSITADKLNVTHLSAIAQNVGTLTGGTISGTTITGNTISGGTINGATITGGTITGVTGTFSGRIYAKNLIDDTAQAFTLTHGKALTIPAFGKKRIIFVPACFCSMRVNSASGSQAGTISATATVTISSSAGGTIQGSNTATGSNATGNVFLSGFFVVNANTTTVINYTSAISGSGTVSCPNIHIIAIC